MLAHINLTIGLQLVLSSQSPYTGAVVAVGCDDGKNDGTSSHGWSMVVEYLANDST